MGLDPTEAMRQMASEFEGVAEGTACTQASFKRGKKSFFFAGPSKGQFKAMFKLSASMDEARAMAADRPDRKGVGKTGWVSAMFTAEEPMEESVWRRWLVESYELSGPKRKK